MKSSLNLFILLLTLSWLLNCMPESVWASDNSEIQNLRKEMRTLKESYEHQISEMQKNYEERMSTLEDKLIEFEERESVNMLEYRIHELEKAQVDSNQIKEDVEDGVFGKINSVVKSATKVFPSMFNPSVSVVVDNVSHYNSSEGRDNSFDMRSAELYFYGSVDPWANAWAVFSGFDDFDVELHEAASEVNLPWYTTLTGGQFFSDFGSLIAKSHDHDLPFVDRPPSLVTIVGGEPIVVGAELGWLAPINHYLHFTVGGYDEFEGELHGFDDILGEEHEHEDIIHRSTDDFAYLARGTTAFDPHPDHNLQLGMTHLNDARLDRQIYGLDFQYNWYPLGKAQHQQLTYGLEILHDREPWATAQERPVPFGEPRTAIIDHEEEEHGHEEEEHEGEEHEHEGELPLHNVQRRWGGYTYLQYKFLPRWHAGLRFDAFQFLTNDFPDYKQVYTYTPYVTFNPSENQRWRLQYNYQKLGHGLYKSRSYSHQVFLQWTLNLGSHRHPFRY